MDRITDKIEIVNADCHPLLSGWPSDAALVTDPPYGIGYKCPKKSKNYGGGFKFVVTEKQANRNAGKRIFGDNVPFDPAPFLRFRWVLLWGADHFRTRLPEDGSLLVWDKTDGGRTTQQRFAHAEFAWTNAKVRANIMRHLWCRMMKTRKGEDGNLALNTPRLHPSQKPVALFTWCLKVLALPTDTLVIDPFMGSGTLGVACYRAGLRYLGVEIDPEYYEIAKERLLRATAQRIMDL
jgi:site-specific DNA-methyltransferase (adenine-specific)/modification methylase